MPSSKARSPERRAYRYATIVRPAFCRSGGRADPWGSRILLDTGRVRPDGLFYNQNGVAIGRRLPNGAIVDPDTLPGYRAQLAIGALAAAPSRAVVEAATQPKLCPDPTAENIAGRSDRAVSYQSQISGLPPGFEIVFSGERYDGCRPENGNLLEGKAEGHADKMTGLEGWLRWFTGGPDLEKQMKNHSEKALGRIVEYHFAEKAMADWARGYAARFPNVVVYYTPPVAQ